MQKLEFDYSKLKGLIVEKYQTNEKFAEAIGMDKAIISRKLNNKTPFSQSEIVIICEALNIDGNTKNCWDYFFSVKC